MLELLVKEIYGKILKTKNKACLHLYYMSHTRENQTFAYAKTKAQ